ncbi:MAG: DnaD domain protein [Oscillospiraceae bacterium]|nr:DnaD domain protein [Oscillospiraceae bacterium]
MNLEKSFYQFIDQHFGKINLTFCSIYLYALRFASDGKRVPKMSQIASHMNLIPSDVHSAWLFWVSKGLASIDGEDVTLSLVDTEAIKSATVDKRFASLAKSVSREIGDLSSRDMETLRYIHEKIALPRQVVLLLIQFAHRDRGKKSMNYIEKMAIDWADKKIDTVEKAERYIANSKKGTDLKKERTAAKPTAAKSKVTNFEPRAKANVDDLEDYWMNELEKQASM